MELNHLRCFFEVARAGSFTAAAKNLHTSQSALSKAVALLEDREGIKLLERSKKGVVLTPLGQEVFDQCNVIFNNVQEIQDRVRGATYKCEGFLSFGSSDHLARYILVDKLKDFREKYPKVVPSVFVGAPNEILEKILKNELEFGLSLSRVNMPGIEYKRLTPFELCLVASTRLHKQITSQDFNEFGIIGSISREFQRHPSYKVFEFLKSSPKINFESNSQELQKRLCLAGEGCVLLAKFMVEEELREKILKEIPLPKPLLADLFLMKRKQHVFTRPAQKFVEEVVSKIKG